MASEKELFTPELVFFDWELESTDDLFEKLNGILLERGNVNEGWLEGITTREKNYATGLRVPSCGFAIPHTDPQYIEKPYIAVIKPKKPIVFGAMAGMGDPVPAEIIINLGVLRDGGQVQTLQTLMNIFANEDSVAEIMAQDTPEGMVATITKHFE